MLALAANSTVQCRDSACRAALTDLCFFFLPLACSAAILLDDKKDEGAVVAVDKTNPLYAPDNFEPWRNAGYTNLAPRGWHEWSDLPAPYKYYDVKVDPKDVENHGFLWNVFTNWRTALPVATLLALPAFVYDVRS